MATFRFNLALLFAATLSAQVTPENYLAFQSISEVRVSPNGQTAMFVVTTTNLKANRTDSQLMQIALPNGRPAPVAKTPEGAHELHWSPDGKRFAYIAGDAVYTQSLNGAPIRICGYDRSNSFLSKSGTMLVWSPDGKQLAFAGTTEPVPAPPDPVIVNRIQYKSRTALSDNRRTHIYVVPSTDAATPRAVTSGDHDEHSLDWAPDGEIVFLSNHEANPDARLNYDIFAVNPATGTTRQITRTPGVELDPKVSPDGSTIAYLATKREITTIDSVAEDAHLFTVPFEGGEPRERTAKLDRRSSALEWSSDGKAIYTLAADHGKTLLYRTIGDQTQLVFDRKAQISAYSPGNKTVVFVMSDSTHPTELFTPEAQLTHLNDVRKLRYVEPEVIHYRSFDNTEVEAFLYMPLDPAAKNPLILSIHGGPHGQFGYAFNPAFQENATRGYATLAINPRGSTGYGQKFADGTLNNWGGGDYTDLSMGVDAVLASHPQLDPARLGVTGGSYGGYMTNWVITQTARFKAAVSLASVSNLVSFYATSLYQDLVHAEFSGFPWDNDNFALLWKWSPIAHVKGVSTPTLFIHGERDNDVHITQAEEMYTALREQNVDAEFARYPREGHGFREPRHQLDVRARTLAWFDKHIR